MAQAPVVVAVTSTFWRNAWKYCGRAYRHPTWDAGTRSRTSLPLQPRPGCRPGLSWAMPTIR